MALEPATFVSPFWLNYDATQSVLRALERAGFEAYCVGGCVRDAVMGVECNDIDIATNARPEEVEQVFTQVPLCNIYATGVQHGTWTVGLGGEVFEITSFRSDTDTDGRHATVEFVNTMEEDAQRRDFTMNAMYMDRKGKVYDPTGLGVNDAIDRVVRFVGDAETRCEEDYLRILRYFRFIARFTPGRGYLWFDQEAIEAIENTKQGLHKISIERISDEMFKILFTDNPLLVLEKMDELGILSLVLGVDASTYNLQRVLHVEAAMGIEVANPLRRLYALTGKAYSRILQSNVDSNYLAKLCDACMYFEREGLEKTAYLFGPDTAKDVYILDAAQKIRPTHFTSINLVSSLHAGDRIEYGASRRFPIVAVDLMNAGYVQGQPLGQELRRLKDLWIESDFALVWNELMDKMTQP